MSSCLLRVGLAAFVLAATVAVGKEADGPVLKADDVKRYADAFNRDDNELYRGAVPNAEAWAFLKENMPLLDCPDEEIQRTYYFRWWSYRKHLKRTPEGWIVDEFLPDVPWAGKYNTISCAAGHHLYEGRWLRDPQYLRDYAAFWFGKGGDPRRYSFWAADAVWQLACVSGDFELPKRLLPELIANYEAWEKTHRDANGLYWQMDDRDGMESSISGALHPQKQGYRATLNSYQYGDALAIARIADLTGKQEVARDYRGKAAVIKKAVQERLWNADAQFFEVIPRGTDKPSDVRELHGYTPWYFNLPDPAYAVAWRLAMDPQVFLAPYGLTTAEQRHPKFAVSYTGHECKWDGPVWPFATAVTLTGLANLLNGGPQETIATKDYFELLRGYARSHQIRLDDGRVVPWIDEVQNPTNGDWISRTMLNRGGAKIPERGKDYNHSTFCDLVISGLIGLRPRADDVVEVNPLVPADAWSYFCLDRVRYHGCELTILYDKSGERYGKGKGLRVFCDGREIAAADRLTRVTGTLQPAPETAGGWKKAGGNPIVRPGYLKWDHDACYKPYAIFDGAKWLLWYNGRHGNVEQIGAVLHEGEDLGFGQADDVGLVGRWSFDGCDGKTVKDLSGAGNDGEVVFGELRREAGTTALELDGLDGQVRVAPKAPFALGTHITSVLWLRTSRVRNNTVLFGIPNAKPEWSTPVFGMYVSGNRVVYGQFGDKRAPKALIESRSGLPLNRWTCVAATSDGETLRLYIDGTLETEQKQRASLGFNGQPLLIGAGLGGKPAFKGRIGELRLYNRALTADEIRALFEAGRPTYGTEPPVTAVSRDGTVIVETHGSNPETSGPWREQPTRLLEKLDGYAASGDRVKLNGYGGCLDLPREKATGFFRTQKIAGRWWLIDPEGCRFYHVGINTVREPRDVKKNFGSSEQWAEKVTTQFRDAGFNGLGNGASTRLQQVNPPLVWVRRHNFLFAFAREKGLVEAASGTQGFPNRCMPVFHPEFPAFCETYGQALAATANDAALLGIMTENEIQCPVDLLDRYLAGDVTNPDLKPGHDAALAWLTAKKGSADLKGVTRRDRYAFIAYAFERYYSIVTPIVRKYDPNHLYLGSRINYSAGEFDNPWFWKMLAPYHDVVSVNYYGRWGVQADELDDWAQWADRPILFTEWYAKALDAVPPLANTHGAGWIVHTQEDRARYYQHFALSALETKSVVGWHFFKYLDDPPESKALDNLGGANKGLFDVYGQPHRPVLDRARAVNREVYPLIGFFDARR